MYEITVENRLDPILPIISDENPEEIMFDIIQAKGVFTDEQAYKAFKNIVEAPLRKDIAKLEKDIKDLKNKLNMASNTIFGLRKALHG